MVIEALLEHFRTNYRDNTNKEKDAAKLALELPGEVRTRRFLEFLAGCRPTTVLVSFIPNIAAHFTIAGVHAGVETCALGASSVA